MSDSNDQETVKVYAAQCEATEFFMGHGSIADPTVPLAADETLEFMRLALDCLGETGRELPGTEFGPTGHADLGGRYDFRRNVIQLDTFELNRWRVLHEMAHWLDPNARSGHPNHGPGFRVLYNALVSVALGNEAGERLSLMFTAYGIPLGDGNWRNVIALS
jgi:hypothetical protein